MQYTMFPTPGLRHWSKTLAKWCPPSVGVFIIVWLVKELTKLRVLLAKISWAVSWVQKAADECNPKLTS